MLLNPKALNNLALVKERAIEISMLAGCLKRKEIRPTKKVLDSAPKAKIQKPIELPLNPPRESFIQKPIELPSDITINTVKEKDLASPKPVKITKNDQSKRINHLTIIASITEVSQFFRGMNISEC